MVLEFVFLMVDFLAPNPVTQPEIPLCDDGSPAWNSNNEPNWACLRDGCSPHASSCWDDRLAHCLDEEGKDLGTCEYSYESCHNRFSCFDLWITCEGTYVCHDDSTVGCTSGTCTTDVGAGPSLKYAV